MEPIVEKTSKELILSELTKERFLRKTNFGNNEIYVVNHHNSPNIMREIGRLREITYREAGGGTGKAIDIDKYDTSEIPYEQLFVWDPDSQEILGGYRFLHLLEIIKRGNINDIATATIFNISDEFTKDYAPYTLELGRSFVQPLYQATKSQSKSMYILDNLWDGLGALSLYYNDIKYFFGKITMYPHFNRQARDLILFFMEKYFGDPKKLVTPIETLNFTVEKEELAKYFSSDNYQENYKILTSMVKNYGENIPPLFSAYIKLSPSMKFFGTALNTSFGQTEESGILITIEDIYDTKKTRHIEGYDKHTSGHL